MVGTIGNCTLETTATGARVEYTARLDRHAMAARRLDRVLSVLSRSKRWATYSIIGYVVFDPTLGFALVPLFIGLIPVTAVQSWCFRRWRRAAARAAFYAAGVRRLDGKWQGRGEPGLTYSDPTHPYASDLDLFGRGSLFELLCTAETRAGRDALSRWLLNPSDRPTILGRQQAVTELRDQVDLREAVAMVRCAGQHITLGGEGDVSRVNRIIPNRAVRVVSSILMGLLIITAVGGFWAGGRWWLWLLGIVIAEAILFFTIRERLIALNGSINQLKRCLAAVAPMTHLIGRTSCTSPVLRQLRETVDSDSRLARAVRRVQYAFALNEPVVLLFLLQMLPLLDRRHRHDVSRARLVITAIGEFEALCMLATYAFEHPQDVFPEIVEPGPQLQAEGLAHPLLLDADGVRNDVSFEPPQRLIIISGSNMSGKTTLLRSVGVNVVLALAGAPVRAQRMRISPFVMGTAMRFSDSLQAGTSHFAAVVQRMKIVIDMQDGQRPLLYLFDEILQGTNSQDRRVGAEAVLRKFVDSGAIGLVSTHDLALTEIVNDLEGKAVNMHFEDRVVDGQMTFDYRLRPGVTQKTNALDVMRSFGLDV